MMLYIYIYREREKERERDHQMDHIFVIKPTILDIDCPVNCKGHISGQSVAGVCILYVSLGVWWGGGGRGKCMPCTHAHTQCLWLRKFGSFSNDVQTAVAKSFKFVKFLCLAQSNVIQQQQQIKNRVNASGNTV